MIIRTMLSINFVIYISQFIFISQMHFFILFLHSIFLIIASYFLHKKLSQQPLGKFFVHGLAVKLIAGVALVFVFRYRYGALADSQTIFDVAVVLANKFYENPLDFLKFCFWDSKIPETYKILMFDWTPQTVFMYKLTSIFCIITYSNFWLVNLYLSFLSYLGLWFCANSLAKKVQNSEKIAVVSFLFFPSTIFWSSGILKESFLWFLSGMMVSMVLSFEIPNNKILNFNSTTLSKILSKNFTNNFKNHLTNLIILAKIVIFCLLGLSLFKLKYYYFAVLVPCLFIYLFGVIILQIAYFQTHIKKIMLFLAIIMILGVITISNFHDNLRLSYFFEGLVNNYYYLANNSDVDNLIYYGFTNDYRYSVMSNIPVALQAAWISPMLWETEGNILKLAAALENTVLVILGMYVFMLKVLNYINKTSQNIEKLHILLLCCGVIYVTVLAIFIALATPNIGTLVRYKVGFLPFVVYMLLATIRNNQNNIHHFTKKYKKS